MLHLTGDTSARCAITPEHRVKCEGSAVYGQLGAPVEANFVEVVAGERYFCARTEEGKVACWGVLPLGFPGATEHYPLCKFDAATTEATWKADVAQAKVAFDECVKAPCPKGMLDCKLGCNNNPVKRRFFRHDVLCEEEPRVTFSSKPVFLEGVLASSLAAYGQQLCFGY